MLVRLALPSFLLGISAGAFLPFQNLFLREHFGLSDASVGAIMGWNALAMGLGAMLGAPVARRFGLRRAAASLRFMMMPGMLLMLIPILGPALVGFFMRGLFVSASYPLNDALVMHATPARQRGTVTSLTNLIWSLAWAITAPISGAIQVRWGFAPVLIIAGTAVVLSSIAIWTTPVDDRTPAV